MMIIVGMMHQLGLNLVLVFYDPSELQDRTVVDKQNIIKLNKITEQRIKYSRETNKNLAALDAAIVNRAKA